MKYLPNILSVSRIPLGLALLVACPLGQWQLAWWLFIAAGITDYIDGPLARRLGVSSDLGNRLDHVSDAVWFHSLLVALVLAGSIPWYYLAEYALVVVGMSLFQRRRVKHGIRPPQSGPTPQQAALGAIAFVYLLSVAGVYLVYRAYGWHWWELIVGLLSVGFIVISKRDRLRPLRLTKTPAQ